MSVNPLLSLRGLQWVRVNGGPAAALRTTLRFIGARATDDEVRRRVMCERHDLARATLTAEVDPIDGVYTPDLAGWFGVSPEFQAAADLFIAATAPGVILAGFAVPTIGTRRKRLVNTGSAAFNVSNTFDAPGYAMGHPRTLAAGEACRLQWDPVGLRWLVNDGLYSGDYVTHDNDLVTHDSGVITVEV